MMPTPQSKVSEEEGVEGWSLGMIPYQALAMATDNFSEERILGRGGFGPVYRGFLREQGGDVAIKKLGHTSHQGVKQYESEVKIITEVRHPNLVKLIGWCDNHGDLMLAYEFMPCGSLDAHLFTGRSLLKWPARYKIVLGLARALMYLHEGCKPCVLHRDIKSSNVLLDSNLNAKLADFGLAMLSNHDTSSTQVSHAAGTRGYWAPEYALAAKASKKSDVYSFGVVALEIACGKKAIHTVPAAEGDGDCDTMLLAEWVWDLHGKGAILEATDERLNGDFVREEMERLLMVGLWCAHPHRQQRPTMRQAIQALLYPETRRVPRLPAKMPPWAYSAAPKQMRSIQVSPSKPSGRSMKPKRSFLARFAWWKRMESSHGGEIRVTGPNRDEQTTGRGEERAAELKEIALRDLRRATKRFAAESKVREDFSTAVYGGHVQIPGMGVVHVDVKRFTSPRLWSGKREVAYLATLAMESSLSDGDRRSPISNN